MMPTIDSSVMALPKLSPDIPFSYNLPGSSGFCTPLAIALLEASLVTDEMLVLGADAPLVKVFASPTEQDLAVAALSAWWTDTQARYPMKYFHWEMHVQDISNVEDLTQSARNSPSPLGWFAFTRNQNRDLPRFSLAHAVGLLEHRLEGFGQTALAVLRDALRALPDSLTPWAAHDWAEMMHWQECTTDEEMLAQAREDGRIRVQVGGPVPGEYDADLMTRARFFGDMPRWVVAPKRVLSRDKIVRAAREKFEKDVIAACDDIATLVNQPAFRYLSLDCGHNRSGQYSTDGAVAMLWREGDSIGAVIDDWLNMNMQSGESVDFIALMQVNLNAQDVVAHLEKIDRMMHLAMVTERLIDLLGEPY
ncbi:PRTRC system protein F [Duganella sp. CT11-25]|uniref:PRTRC system protein F n=1 Tax=unclassified Duganella TaxID=2636909 RepID=UPI0039B08D53